MAPIRGAAFFSSRSRPYYCISLHVHMLRLNQDFNLAQAYLALFLKLHLRLIAEQPVLMRETEDLLELLERTWTTIQTLLNQNMCLLSYIKSALL
ncbi:WD repeat-containing protein 36 [Clarias magur]|uniref:WD repeat-containing protein 36 n=1 Tax=Clarias magur TaxID=1594786 RepID=A0A8J4XFE9_CLAMG|nr:WD repeat-containing protein 36 [Clarias magur]